jgi:hypothetical protein
MGRVFRVRHVATLEWVSDMVAASNDRAPVEPGTDG